VVRLDPALEALHRVERLLDDRLRVRVRADEWLDEREHEARDARHLDALDVFVRAHAQRLAAADASRARDRDRSRAAAAATVIVVAAPAGLSRAMISPEGRFRNFFLIAMVKAPPGA
jgi:hypothetical protein